MQVNNSKVLEENYGSATEKISYYGDGASRITKEEKVSNQTATLKAGLKDFFVSAFLPQGYPDSVSDDYLEYQLYDTLQAFCSSITGTLATHAVLKGYGVGDQTATATAATLTWMLKDGAGMIGRILFAWMKGTELDCDPKRWRFYADILNDIAIFLDLTGPLFSSYFILILCFSSLARSIVGVAGGATRAALTLHQAKRDNMADVSAKDGSQETLVNLLALISGLIITPLVADQTLLVWFLFVVFTFLHLASNYCAVSAVVMDTLSLQRLSLLLEHYHGPDGKILNPRKIARMEPVLRRKTYNSKINIGVSIEKLELHNCPINTYKSTKYIIKRNTSKKVIDIALSRGITERDIRMACVHALILDLNLVMSRSVPDKDIVISDINRLKSVQTENFVMEKSFTEFEESLVANGWNLNRYNIIVNEWRYRWLKTS